MLQNRPVDARFRRLFTPGRIGKLWVKNRIVRAPMLTGLGTSDGCVTERLVNHYKELALGGTGVIIVEFAAAIYILGGVNLGYAGESRLNLAP